MHDAKFVTHTHTEDSLRYYIGLHKYWPAPRLSTDHSGLECASVFELIT